MSNGNGSRAWTVTIRPIDVAAAVAWVAAIALVIGVTAHGQWSPLVLWAFLASTGATALTLVAVATWLHARDSDVDYREGLMQGRTMEAMRGSDREGW